MFSCYTALFHIMVHCVLMCNYYLLFCMCCCVVIACVAFCHNIAYRNLLFNVVLPCVKLVIVYCVVPYFAMMHRSAIYCT